MKNISHILYEIQDKENKDHKSEWSKIDSFALRKSKRVSLNRYDVKPRFQVLELFFHGYIIG
jgi:hypothetical protein